MAAHEVRIRDGGDLVKVREPVTVALLSFFTAGIYAIFWYYFVNRELASLGRSKGTDELGDSPGTSVLAVTLGALVIVPAIISIIHTAKRLEAAQRLSGRQELISVGLAVVAWIIFFPVGAWYAQSELNKVWATETEQSGEAQAIPPGSPDSGATERGVSEQESSQQ